MLLGFVQGATQKETLDRIERAIREAAERFKVDPDLIRAVIKKESSFRPHAVSPVGAQGLMQLMPGTAARYGVRDPFNIEQNVMGGTRYLADLIKEFKDLRLALAAYNAGEGAVRAYLPNRPDVNSYVGGSGRRWTVSEEAAQRAQGIPQNNQTPEYVSAVMRFFAAFQSGGATSAVPVVIQNLPALKDFFGQFVGKGYTPSIALGHAVPDRPAGGDLTGGVGYFAGDFNPRGFAEKLYALQKSMPASERTTVAAQADWQHTVSMMAEEFHISRAVMLKIQDMVAQRLEEERAALASLSAQGAADGGSFRPGAFLNVTDEQARRALEIATRGGSGLIPQERSPYLATSVTAQPFASAQLVAKDVGDTFTNLPPLIKQTGKDAEKEAAEIARNISGMFGGLLQSTLRGQWREGLKGLKDDFMSWAVSLAQDWVESKIFKLLSPKGSGGASGGGGLLGNIFGGLKSLFGFGGGSAAAGSAASSVASGGLTAAASAGTNAAFVSSMQAAGASQLAAMLGFGGAGVAGGVGAGAAVGGSAAAGGTAAAGGSSMLGSMGALLTNPWTAVVAGGLIAGFALWKHFSHKTEKELRKAIQQARGVDIKDMGVLQQIKQIGEQAFGRGQVRKHLGEVIQLNPVQEIIDNYAVSTGQQAERPQMPHDFLYNAVGGPSSPPISVNGNTLMPSPFTGGQPLAQATGRGPTGNAIAEAINGLREIQRQQMTMQMHTVEAVRANTAALSTIKSANFNELLIKSTDDHSVERAIGAAAVKSHESNYDFTRRLLEMMGFAR